MMCRQLQLHAKVLDANQRFNRNATLDELVQLTFGEVADLHIQRVRDQIEAAVALMHRHKLRLHSLAGTPPC